MNIELLRKIAAVIQEKPEKFNMRSFTGRGKCGTTHCIGGWAAHFTGKAVPFTCRDGAEALGINEDQAKSLFYVTQDDEPLWPKRFLGRKKKGKSIEQSWWKPTPRQAAARIEHFIKTDGEE